MHVNSSEEEDLQMLLEHSGEDAQTFESFRLLKQWLVESDPIKDWPVEGRLPRIRARVMAVVEKELKRPSTSARDAFLSPDL